MLTLHIQEEEITTVEDITHLVLQEELIMFVQLAQIHVLLDLLKIKEQEIILEIQETQDK